MRSFTLEYWIDDSWYVGRIKEVPGVFSQGATLAELKENIREAYKLMVDDCPVIPVPGTAKEIAIRV